MSLPEIRELFGTPSGAQAHVVKPGFIDLVPVPLDQVDRCEYPLRLIYSPHPSGYHGGALAVFRLMNIELDANKKLTGFKYDERLGNF